MNFLRNWWRRWCLHEAEHHRDAAWNVYKNCDDYRNDTGRKGFHDAETCPYCNIASAYHISQRDRWYQRYDRVNL